MHTDSYLLDLDELVLLCRDDRARAYINEAVSCYRSGAFRASIVVTWVAVCYDIIDKLRELALSGDKEATQRLRLLEDARNRNDIGFLLRFENELLFLAETKFELISSSERQDLARLQDDRNRCAHPSMVSEDQSFSPPGELARLHIRIAVTHLLQHQPVQGKYALDRLLREVDSAYFPSNTSDATAALSAGPLKRARISLVRSFCTVLLKEYVSSNADYKRRSRFIAALNVLKIIRHDAFLQIIREQAPKLFSDLPDAELSKLCRLIAALPELMDALAVGTKTRITMYIENIPSDAFGDLELYYKTPCLKEYAERRMLSATKIDFSHALFLAMPAILCDVLIRKYRQSGSFADANWAAGVIMQNIADFSAPQLIEIIKNITSNSQLTGSNTLPTLINVIRSSLDLPGDEFDILLTDSGLAIHRRSRTETPEG